MDFINDFFTSPFFLVGFFIFALVVVPLVFFFGAPIMRLRLAKALREQGMRTNGRVTKLKHEVQEHSKTKAPRNFYSVSYEFEVNGQTYSSQQSVRANVYNALREGNSVGVMYMPANPAQAMLASSVQQSQP